MAGKAARKNIGGGTWYSGGNSKVADEAKEKNTGGAVSAPPAKKRKFGGRTVGAPSGATAAPRLDKRARGGGIQKFSTGGGADKNPFSSAGANIGRGGKKGK